MSRSRILTAVTAPMLAVIAAAATPTAAQVTEQTFRSGRTGDLVSLCAASEADAAGLAARAWCQGFIVSAAQYHGSIAAADPTHARIYCQPDPNLTLDEVRARFVGWAQSNPQYADTKAIDGLMRFAASTWPCPAPTAGSRR
jgi:hypothetical protein